MTEILLWILAVLLVVSGVLAILRRELVTGIILIILGFLVVPGGTRVFDL